MVGQCLYKSQLHLDYGTLNLDGRSLKHSWFLMMKNLDDVSLTVPLQVEGRSLVRHEG